MAYGAAIQPFSARFRPNFAPISIEFLWEAACVHVAAPQEEHHDEMGPRRPAELDEHQLGEPLATKRKARNVVVS